MIRAIGAVVGRLERVFTANVRLSNDEAGDVGWIARCSRCGPVQQRFRAGKLEMQRLLIPEPVHLPVLQAAQALEHWDELAELGLTVEDFGGRTVLLTIYPAILSKRSPAEILRAVVDYLVTKERARSPEQLLSDLLSLMACHGAVRSGDRLTPQEVDALVAQPELAQDTHQCPHGRPTSLLFTRHDLDRQFRRI